MPIPGTWDDPKKKLTDDPGALPQAGTNNPALVITNVSGGVPSGGSTTITWTTSQASSSKVSYGIAYQGRSQVTSETNTGQGNGVTSHSVTLSGLKVGQPYLFRVHSRLMGGKDGGNNNVQVGYQFIAVGVFVAA
jgi:hypothetical protein